MFKLKNHKIKTGGVEGLREKLDAEIARSLIAQENIAIVETEVERLDGGLCPGPNVIKLWKAVNNVCWHKLQCLPLA